MPDPNNPYLQFLPPTGGGAPAPQSQPSQPAPDAQSSNPYLQFVTPQPPQQQPMGAAAAPASISSGQNLVPQSFVDDIYHREGSADDSVSPKGAIGRGQLMPATAAPYLRPGEDIHDPTVNARVMRAHLNDLWKKYDGDEDAIRVAYNAGPGVADRWLKSGRDQSVLPEETQKYLGLKPVAFNPATQWKLGDNNTLVSDTGTGGWDVSIPAVEKAQEEPDSTVKWTPVKDLLASLPPIEDTGRNRAQQRELTQSLAKDEPIDSLPTVDVKVDKSGKATISDFDGRHRLEEAQNRGIEFVPVQFKGLKSGQEVTSLQGLREGSKPLDIKALQPVNVPQMRENEGFQEAVRNRELLGSGIERTIGGGAQLLEHVLPSGVVSGISDFNNWLRSQGLPLAKMEPGSLEQGQQNLENRISQLEAQSHLPGVTAVGEAAPLVPVAGLVGGASAAEPGLVNALRAIGKAIPGSALVGGAMGAVQPVPEGQDYGPGVAQNALSGAATGAALPGVGAVLGSGTAAVARGLGSLGQKLINTPLGQRIAEPVLRWLGKSEPELSSKEAHIIDRIARSVGLGGPTAQDMLDLAKANQDKPLTVADLGGPRTAGVLRSAFRYGSEDASKNIAETLQGRGGPERFGRVSSDIGRAFGQGDAYGIGKALIESRKAAADPAFKEALKPGSTAPLADLLHEQKARAEDEYNAAARDVANLSGRTDVRGKPVYRVPASAKTKKAVAERAKKLPAAKEPEKADVAQLLTGKPTEEQVVAPAAPSLALERATKAATTAANKLREITAAHDAAQEAARQGIRGAVWSPRLQRLLANPEFRPGLSEGMRILRNEADARGEEFNPKDYAITGTDSEGNPIVSKVPTMRLIHAARRGLNDVIGRSRDPLTGRLNKTQLVSSQLELLNALTDESRKLNPLYGKALDIWSDDSKAYDALHWGQDVLKRHLTENADWMASHSDNEKEFARLGLGSTLRDDLSRTDVSPAALARVLHTHDRERLQPMFSSPVEEQKFLDSLTRERQMGALESHVLGGLPRADVSEDRVRKAAEAAMTAWHLSRGSPWGLYHGIRLARAMHLGRQAQDEAIAKYLGSPLNEPGSAGINFLQRAAAMGLSKTSNALRGLNAGRRALPLLVPPAVGALGQ